MTMIKSTSATITITPPDIRTILLKISGVTPLVINKFSHKAKQEMMAKQEAGSTAATRKKREPKDFEAIGHAARHIAEDGWDGIHAAAFRNAAISACRAAGFVMTKAKLAIFVEPDGFDQEDATPLVRITEGDAEIIVSPCRNETGVIDLRPRPTYRRWAADLRIRYDNGILTAEDVVNLINRVGAQVGIGEGRPDSKKSAGQGNGLFKIVAGEYQS